MSVITDLFNGSGYIYQVKPSGAIDTFPNDYTTANKILVEAVKSRIIYEAQAVDTFDFTDPNYGSRFYLNDDVAAPVHDITGALEVTDYLILDTRNDLMEGDIVSGDVEVTRKSRVTVIPLVPEVGTSDDLISLSGDLLVGDLVILLPKGGGPTYVITIKDEDADGVVGGNFALHDGQDIVLNGTNDVCIFIKNSDAIKEIARPDSQLLSIAKKTLSAGGGNYYTLDPSGGAARITTKRGLVILGGGATLAAPWTVGGEDGGDTSISQGTTLDIILDSPLYTDRQFGLSLTIFGIEIPDTYCEDYNFVVRAWYNEVDGQWESRLLVDQLKGEPRNIFGDGSGSGETEPLYTINDALIIAPAAVAFKTLSHSEHTEGLITFAGVVVMIDGIAAGDNATLGTGLIRLWHPGDYASVDWICPVFRGSSLAGYCMIQVYDDMTIYAPSNFAILADDEIYLANISYVATR